MLIYETIKKLCKQKGVTITGTEKELGFARGSLCKINTSTPGLERVQKSADFFGITVEELVGDENPSDAKRNALTAKDERDIK